MGSAGIEGHGFPGDAGDELSLRKAFDDIHASLGPTEVLVYNAFAFHQANLSVLRPAQLVDDFRVNVVGALISAQIVITHMKAVSRGTILFTGGGLALEPQPSASSLAIGKAGFAIWPSVFTKNSPYLTFTLRRSPSCGYVREGTRFSPGNIAEFFFHLHQQSEGQWDREFVYQ